MDSLTRKFKQSINLNSNSIDSNIIKQYQANLKIFLKKVDDQVFNLIEKYESQIKQLKKQNKTLKEKLNKYESNRQDPTILRTNFKNMSTISKMFSDEKNSPIKPKVLPLNSVQKSNFSPGSTFKSYLDYSGQDLSSSRFQVQKNKKKVVQQNLLTSLEAGKNNLDINTTKLLDLLGKNKKSKKLQSQSEQQQIEVNSTSEKNQVMNTSLSSVCESLDNSFHGKRSKKKNELKRKEKQRIKQMKLEEAKRNYKEKKQQGLKNLLKNIRQNVSSTQQKPLQTIKSLKIAHSGYDNETNIQKRQKDSPSKSKVLIDPNPIDISQRKIKSIKQQTQIKPQSILKNTSTILTKSILSDSSYH